MGINAPCPISATHNISSFNCGDNTLNEWLQRRSIKNDNSSASRTFVVCEDNTIIGYYSLAVGAVARDETSSKIRRNMPDPIPVMVLGRLAVDSNWQGKHIGVGMLKDAIERTLIVAQHAGVRAILVHAISIEAKKFYQHWGFHASPTNDMTLMISLNEAKQAMIK